MIARRAVRVRVRGHARKPIDKIRDASIVAYVDLEGIGRRGLRPAGAARADAERRRRSTGSYYRQYSRPMTTDALFGTDGIRGTAGRFRSTFRRCAESARRSCKALPDPAARLLVGRDTRESGDVDRARAGLWCARWLVRRCTSIGVAPTPAVAYLTGSLDFDAGVVISASHNPYQDNGIKVFSGAGVKYSAASSRQRIEDARGRYVMAGADGRGDGVPTRGASAEISRSCPHGAAEPARARAHPDGGRLCQRRDDGRGPGAVQRARLRSDDDRGRAGRPQHQ